MTLYDMGRRITQLVLQRDTAVGILQNGPQPHNVTDAIAELTGGPKPGEPGGPEVFDRERRKKFLVVPTAEVAAAAARKHADQRRRHRQAAAKQAKKGPHA